MIFKCSKGIVAAIRGKYDEYYPTVAENEHFSDYTASENVMAFHDTPAKSHLPRGARARRENGKL